MANTFLGYGQVSGTSGVVALSGLTGKPLKEGMDFNHEFDEDIIKAEQGDDCAWRAFNEKYTGDLKMRLVDTTSGSSKASAAALAAVLVPYAVVTISGCDIASWNTTYQVVPGSSVGLKNTTAGDMSWKLRRYADAAQNALAATTPG